MDIKFKKVKGSKIEIEGTLLPEEFNEYWQIELNAATASVQIKGFRPGSTPKEMAEKAVNKEKIFEDAINSAIRDILEEKSQDNHWVIVDRPKVEVLEANPAMVVKSDSGASPRKEKDNAPGLKFKAEITVLPDVELPDYKKIAKEFLAKKEEVQVTPEEIEKTMEWIRESRVTLQSKKDGAELEDLVEIDVLSSCEGKAIPNGKVEKDKFILGKSHYMVGFDDQIKGKKEGDEFTFSIKAPEKYWRKELQGKNIDFKVKIYSVSKRILPELNDEFAKLLGPTFTSLQVLRENVTSGIKIEKEEKEKEKNRAKILEEINKKSVIDLPEILISRTLDGLVEEAKASGAKDVKDEDLRKGLSERAKNRAISSLILHKIAEIEKLEPDSKEVLEEITKNNLDKDNSYDYVYSILRNKKVFELLEKS
ncbi:MAG: trigger factor [Candidatus Pacebacteria bacterium]|nr:trigger factor [Candidatus Paceibacterota bacterium]